MKLSSLFQAAVRCVALASIFVVTGASAAPLALYSGPAITAAMKSDPRACLNIGDAISCSAGMLNVLSGRTDTDSSALDAAPGGGFVIQTPQGALKDSIVVGTGGNAATGNGDTNPPMFSRSTK